MTPYINEFLFEINQYPRSPLSGCEGFTVKDYFFYDSSIKEYGYRDTVIPTSQILNKQEIPEESIIRILINNRTPFLRRQIDLTSQTEKWFFETKVLEEIK